MARNSSVLSAPCWCRSAATPSTISPITDRQGREEGETTMKQMSRRHFTSALAGAVAMAGVRPASAQAYPSRPIKLVVPFPPGNMSDLIGRRLAEELQARQGTTLVVDNRAGATGVIGVQAVTSAEPDGYTLLVSSNSPLTVNPA